MPSITEIINALIGFLLSVVIGAFFQRWLSRAKPMIIIRAVGFKGSEKLIRIPDKMVALSKVNGWLRALKEYSSFVDLLAEHKRVSEVAERLKIAIPIAVNWIRDNEANKQTTLSILDIKNHPYVNSTITASTVDGMIRRSQMPPPPISLDKVNEYERIADLAQNKEGWVLLLNERYLTWKTENVEGENRKKDIELCAESFARGIKQNIVFYMRSFVNDANKDLNEINEFKQLLEESLLPEARLSVEISIYNSGQSAVAIRPYMGLKILHTSFEKKPFILSVHKIAAGNSQQEKTSKISGSEVVTENFLPETSANPYISVSPGEMQEIVLVAAEPLGKIDGTTIKNIYQTGLLTCKIVAETITNKQIWSSPAIFSNQITTDEKTKLEKIIING